MAYYTRKHWTSTANAAVSVKRTQVHATLHYPGWGTSSIRTTDWSLDRCFRQLRAWRNMHVGSGAYREVAYNLYALPTGDVAEGRGNRQNGANGTSTANRAGMSVQVLIGDDEPLTAGHLGAIFEAFALLERWHPGITKRQYGHSHWVSTSCPGPHVRAGIPYRPSTAPIDGGGTGLLGEAPALSRGFADVDDTQLWLNTLGFEAGPVDGKFGTKTAAATRAAQQYLGITPADGRPGPATRAILEDAVNQLSKIAADVKAIRARTDRYLDAPIGAIPGKVLTTTVPNEGMHKGGRTDMRTKIGWQAHNFTQTHQLLAQLVGELAGVQEALRAVNSGEPLDLDQVRAASRDGVSQALDSLEVTVTKGD